MKTITFIDGENFVYQLRDSLAKRRLIKYRDELARVDIRKLLSDLLSDPTMKQSKILYYAAKVKVVDNTPELKERTERYAVEAQKWREVLTRQNIDYIEAGHLLVRDGKPCQQCGHKEPVLTEKGVDVHLATDLIRSSGANVRLVLLSSDGDLIPAVEEAKRRGAEVVYVGFYGVSNNTLANASSRRLIINGKLAAGALEPKESTSASRSTAKTKHQRAGRRPTAEDSLMLAIEQQAQHDHKQDQSSNG